MSPAFDTVTIGAKLTLVATVEGNGGVTFYHTTVTWSSSATTVATVDSTGVVTGVAVGTVTITAVSNSNPQVRGAATVTVTPAGARETLSRLGAVRVTGLSVILTPVL